MERIGVGTDAAEQIVDYLCTAHAALGALPDRDTVVFERFFDESGGMQLVIHSRFGSRLNRAWGLALRKRFCRKFNFELQAAATEDAIVLSLSESHSFALDEVARYLSPETVRDVLTQALLDAPMFDVRWRWNANVSLAIPRFRGGAKVPPNIQRMQAEDLVAAVFPDQIACAENLAGPRAIPDHPLVEQTIADALTEAMDIDGLETLVRRLGDGDLRVVARDLTEPSPLAAEVLDARPYAFLDDAPLEERRARAVTMRRGLDPASAADIGRLDADAIDRVCDEAWPDAATPDEVHDALVVLGFATTAEAIAGRGADPADVARKLASGERSGWSAHLDALVASGRATRFRTPGGGPVLWCAAERLAEIEAALGGGRADPPLALPEELRTASGRDAALAEVLRARLGCLGPVTATRLASDIGVTAVDVDVALVAWRPRAACSAGGSRPMPLPSNGASGACSPASTATRSAGCGARSSPCRGRSSSASCSSGSGSSPTTGARATRRSPPSSPSSKGSRRRPRPGSRRSCRPGSWGLRRTCSTGCASPAGLRGRAWCLRCARRRGVRSGRFDRLRLRCFRGRGGGRLRCGWRRVGRWRRRDGRDGWRSTGGASSFPRFDGAARFRGRGSERWRDGGFGNTLFRHEQGEQGHEQARSSFPRVETSRPRRSPPGPGASSRTSKPAERRSSTTFSRRPAPAGLDAAAALGELIAQGRVSADGFAGLRAFTGASARRLRAIAEAGRWSCVARRAADAGDVGEDGVEAVARTLLRRYGVVFKPLLARESITVPWRDLLREFRRLEARGEIRGGRFVAGFTGEQYALPEAVETLRRVRRAPADGAIVTLSAADPLNLTGVVCLGERVSATASTRIAFRDGVPIATLTGSRKIDWIEPQSPEQEWEGRNALASEAYSGIGCAVWGGWVTRVGQMGRGAPFERSPDRFAMRSCARCMPPISRSSECPMLSVESSWVPGWPLSTWKRRSRRDYERAIGDR